MTSPSPQSNPQPSTMPADTTQPFRIDIPPAQLDDLHDRLSRTRRARDVPGQPVASLSPDLPCANDPELFFAESPSDVEMAKALCRECPARAACLAGALERTEPWGVWGGELFLRGAIVPRKRPRGRPRKAGVAA